MVKERFFHDQISAAICKRPKSFSPRVMLLRNLLDQGARKTRQIVIVIVFKLDSPWAAAAPLSYLDLTLERPLN